MEILKENLSAQRLALYTGGVAAILASICCLGPFLLFTIGLSSATVLYFITAAEWSRPFFILIALIALMYSYQYIWHPTPSNYSVETCSTKKNMMAYRVFFTFVTLLIILVFMLPYIATNDAHNI